MYRPASSVVTVCGTLRSDSVTVTVAPGKAPPLTSVTRPRTAAVYDDCAQAAPETASAMQSKETARKRFWIRLILPLRFGLAAAGVVLSGFPISRPFVRATPGVPGPAV